MYSKGELMAIHILSMVTALACIIFVTGTLNLIAYLQEAIDKEPQVIVTYIDAKDNSTKPEVVMDIKKKPEPVPVKEVVKVAKPISKPKVLPVTKPKPKTDESVYLLAQIINAEAKGESYNGKLAVGNVIMNRMSHKGFPNTLREVIFQRNQFSPVIDGSIYNKPSKESVNAAIEVLNGKRIVGSKAVYFYNPKTATNDWIFSRTTITQIGNHRFAY